MKRPKFIKGNLYWIRAFVPKNQKPTEDYNDCVVRYIEKDKGESGTGHVIKVIASSTAIDDTTYRIGIPFCAGYNPVTGDIEHVPYTQVIFVGKNTREDCYIIRNFKPHDAPLCVGWEHYSKDLLNILKGDRRETHTTVEERSTRA